jgi:[NiFe] hydrogenase assembly HybE family chaperone
VSVLSLQQINHQLEITFTHIQTERMKDVPIINDKLFVKAIDFQNWQDYYLGILVTPWFMNLLLLPLDNTKASDDEFNIGQEIPHIFPSGRYTFIAAYEEALGSYQSCSLFSPMFEFENQEAAELTAKAALIALFDDDNEDIASQHPAQKIEKIWNGEAIDTTQKANFDDIQIDELKACLDETTSLEEKLQEPISRRQFLQGKISGNSRTL